MVWSVGTHEVRFTVSTIDWNVPLSVSQTCIIKKKKNIVSANSVKSLCIGRAVILLSVSEPHCLLKTRHTFERDRFQHFFIHFFVKS